MLIIILSALSKSNSVLFTIGFWLLSITSFLSWGISSSFQVKNTTTKYVFYNSCNLLYTYHEVSEKRARCLLRLSYTIQESLFLESWFFLSLHSQYHHFFHLQCLNKSMTKISKTVIIPIIYMIYAHISVLMTAPEVYWHQNTLLLFFSKPCSSFKYHLKCHFFHQASSDGSTI